VESYLHLDAAAIRRHFQRAANSYAANAAVADIIHARLMEHLEVINLTPSHILDLGGGDGKGAALLARRYPGAAVTVVDISHALLRSSIVHASWSSRVVSAFKGGRIRRLCADMHALPVASGSLDFVWSNLALPWAVDIDAVLKECSRVLAPGGLFMFSSCGPDTLQELRRLPQSESRIHPFPDMHDVGDGLMRAGLAGPVMEMEKLSITFDDLTALRRELHLIGAGNALRSRGHGLGGREFHAAWKALEASHPDQMAITVEAVYGHAWKMRAANKARVDEGAPTVIKMHFPRKSESNPD
jgi:malonyl-CoA O-methyltransferase